LVSHTLIPKHEVLDPESIEKLLKKHGITRNELPQIKSSDAALEGLDAKVGDVIRITRNSFTAGEALYYRLVVVG
jgi:DNA-directed RNA polymerase subunit H